MPLLKFSHFPKVFLLGFCCIYIIFPINLLPRITASFSFNFKYFHKITLVPSVVILTFAKPKQAPCVLSVLSFCVVLFWRKYFMWFMFLRIYWDLWPVMWSILKNVQCPNKNMYCLVVQWNVLKMVIRSIDLCTT